MDRWLIRNPAGTTADFRAGLFTSLREVEAVVTEYTTAPGALGHESLLELYINAQPSSLRGLLTRVRDANGLTRESKGPDAVRKFIGHL